jgi:hypothetical protein
MCPHCGRTSVTNGFPCDYCRGYAHRPSVVELTIASIWRPIKIGAFYYATNGAETSRQNWVMRDSCEDHCRRLNDPTYDPTQ